MGLPFANGERARPFNLQTYEMMSKQFLITECSSLKPGMILTQLRRVVSLWQPLPRAAMLHLAFILF